MFFLINLLANPTGLRKYLMKSIVVLTNGWVFCGTYVPGTKVARIDDAACVRRWGTTAGLGQLALEGPTKETELDPCGTVLLTQPAAVLFVIPAPAL